MCSLQELHEIGFFSVEFALFGLYAAARGLERTYAEIQEKGTTADVGERLMSFDEFNAVVGLETRYADDKRYRA